MFWPILSVVQCFLNILSAGDLVYLNIIIYNYDIVITSVYIYITRSAYIEYGIEILASQGIPIVELESIYLEYS